MPEDLPVLPREPACPAALVIAGACASQQGVVCRVMQREQDEEPGVGMSAGALGVLRSAEGGTYLNLKSDPGSVTAFCHGRAVPMVHQDDVARASYTACPVWAAEKDRVAEGRERLVVEQEPEPVAMGVSSIDSADPWALAREGLDELAPERRAA